MKVKFYLLILFFFLTAFLIPSKKKIKLWLIGDSTMSVKETKTYPETGWGMPFVYFWDSTVAVDNRAMNGRSTRTFIEEKRWDPVVSEMKEGDYVFIQFGHNDEVPSKKSYTSEIEFKTNLARYVTDTKNKKAHPVLLTPVARRKFDGGGHVTGTHDVYSGIVRDVAAEQKVPLIDLDRKGQELYQHFGEEYSRLLFLQLKPGEHPNYPEGRDDNTHFNELGARLIAEIVLQDIKESIPVLAERIIRQPPKP